MLRTSTRSTQSRSPTPTSAVRLGGVTPTAKAQASQQVSLHSCHCSPITYRALQRRISALSKSQRPGRSCGTHCHGDPLLPESLSSLNRRPGEESTEQGCPRNQVTSIGKIRPRQHGAERFIQSWSRFSSYCRANTP